MIRVKLRTALHFKRFFGNGELEISVPKGNTIRELLDELVDTRGEELASSLFDTNGTSLLPRVRVLVNGQDIGFLNGFETVLQHGDEVLILPPAAGG